MKRVYFLTTIIALGLFASCTDDPGTVPDPITPGTVVETDTPYSAMLMVGAWPNTAYYIAGVSSLSEGEINLQGNGAEMTGELYAQDVIQHNGYYYHANYGSGQFGKYYVKDGALVTEKKIQFTELNWDSYTWVDDETLVIFGKNGDANEGRYAVVKVAEMRIESSGKLELNAIPEGFDTYSIGFAEYRSGKIFLHYGMGSSDYSNYPAMSVYAKSFVAVIDFESMEVEKSLERNDLKAVAGPTVYAPTSFLDESGDLYFISDPVYNYNYEAPSAMYRIKQGQTELDSDYFFNFSETVENGMGAAMWYLGGGKAIIRTRVSGQSIDAEHSFSIVDTQSGRLIEKLALPADVGERMVQAVVVEDGKAYIAVNSLDRDFIWIYDIASGSLTQGAEFVGGVDYILRLEKLN